MILEVNLGISLKGSTADAPGEAQARALEEGYKLQRHDLGAQHHYRSVIGVRPWRHIYMFDRIIARAVDIFGLERSQILNRSHRAIYVLPRHAVMWALCQMGYSTSKIGGWMDRDHSTVIHGRRRCEDIQKRDMGYRRACERLLESGG